MNLTLSKETFGREVVQLGFLVQNESGVFFSHFPHKRLTEPKELNILLTIAFILTVALKVFIREVKYLIYRME